MIDEDKWGGREQVLHYRRALETLTADVVQHRLANRLPIGDTPEANPPYEFARAWLAEQTLERRKAENRRYQLVLIVAIVSAVAAMIAAVPVVKSWFTLG